MSPRHPERRRTLRHACLTGAIGAAAITLLAAGPADAAARTAGSVPADVASVRVDDAARISALSEDAQARTAPKNHRQMPTVSEALQVALSQVGVTEDPAGGTKFNQWFMSTPYAQQGAQRWGGTVADYANANWCDMFVSWVGDQARVRGMGDDAFTPTHAKWFQQQGRWGTVPKPGAVVFFSFSGNKSVDGIEHVGIVVKDNHDGTIQTVEGNTDNAVKVRTRPVSYVVGYGYPQYAQ